MSKMDMDELCDEREIARLQQALYELDLEDMERSREWRWWLMLRIRLLRVLLVIIEYVLSFYHWIKSFKRQ